MAKLLHIESSPRKDRSSSIAVARRFLEVYQAKNPNDMVETLDLWEANLPRFDGSTIEAKYAILNGQPHTQEQRIAWQAVVKLAEHFKSADKYLFSLPMWNFGIPYVLKHYIDVLVQPGLTFSYTPGEGYKGLVTGRAAAAVYARGGAYSAGTGAEGYDKQSDYLRAILGFIGLTDVRQVFVEPMIAGGQEMKEKAIAVAKDQATKLAQMF